MCECGCTSNDERYTFPAPGKFVYLLTLSKGCVSCDAGAGVTIERIPKKRMKELYQDFVDGELKFEKWTDSEAVAVITGPRKHEFVKALLPQLVGFAIGGMCDDGVLDESGAEVMLEDLYADAQFKPAIVTSEARC